VFVLGRLVRIHGKMYEHYTTLTTKDTLVGTVQNFVRNLQFQGGLPIESTAQIADFSVGFQ
jgi:hypothetical protein